ncbi:MAG: DUF3127 domain-containing protein [Bacteroidota bacterium]
MNFEIQGTVVHLLPEQTGTGKNGAWIKKDFVIETVEQQFNKKISFSAWGDKAEQVKTLNVGENVKVFFNIESREFNNKWYTDLRIWKLEKLSGAVAFEAPVNNLTEADFNTPASEADDLPF